MLQQSVQTGLVDLGRLRVVLENLKKLLQFALHQLPLQTQINPLVSNQYMSWYYRNQQPQYSFANNYNNYYPSEHSTYPTNYSQYRGWRRTSPKLDYPETRFGIDQANHRAEYNYNAANSDFGVRRGHINQDWEYKSGKSWPIQPGLYQQETWGQWGIRDSRVRLAHEGAVDRIFSRY